MSKGKILITTRSFRRMEGEHKQILIDAGYEMVDSPFQRPVEAHELADLLVDIDAAILGVDDVSAEAFSKANKLKVVSRYGVGVDKVDLAAATDKGIVVTNTPGGNANAVAELALGFMLSLSRNIPRQDRQVRGEDWSLLKGVELAGKTLGILGMGRIGQRVAELANVFGMTILFYDPYAPSDDFLNRVPCQSSEVERILTDSDFVSLHLPLLPQTANMIDADALSKMKNTAFLINTARGGVVDEVALNDALISRTIAGAAFDAFAEEPSIGNPLIQHDNFISTPHAGSSTEQTTLRMGLMASQNALAVLNGERPEFVVNPEVYDKA